MLLDEPFSALGPNQKSELIDLVDSLSKEQDISMAPGDMVWVRTPGGGGYGDPLKRPPLAVFEDVRLGRVSIEQALMFYGVIVKVDNEGKLSLDEISSKEERKRSVESEKFENES